MRVAEARGRVIEKLEEAAASGDENVAAQVSNFSRAVLIALAAYDADADIDLQELTIKTSTAGRILGFSQEYVRELVRGKVLEAAKQNGEFQIPLSSVVRLPAVRSAARPGGPPVPRRGRYAQGQDMACLRLPVRPPVRTNGRRRRPDYPETAEHAVGRSRRGGSGQTLPRNTWVNMSVSWTDCGVPECTTRPMFRT